MNLLKQSASHQWKFWKIVSIYNFKHIIFCFYALPWLKSARIKSSKFFLEYHDNDTTVGRNVRYFTVKFDALNLKIK